MACKSRVSLVASSYSYWKGTHLSEGGLHQGVVAVVVVVVVVVVEEVEGVVGGEM